MDKRLVLSFLKLTPEWQSLLEDFPEAEVEASLIFLESKEKGCPAVWIGIEDRARMLYPGIDWVDVDLPLTEETERQHFLDSSQYFPVQPVTFEGRETFLYMKVRDGWTKEYAISFEQMMRVPLEERASPKHGELLEYLIENGDPELREALSLLLTRTFDFEGTNQDDHSPPTLH